MKVKRLVALILALTLAVTVFALPASADDSEAQGYHEDQILSSTTFTVCPNCGSRGNEFRRKDGNFYGTGSTTRVDYCSLYSGVHNHYNGYWYGNYHCAKCGDITLFESYGTKCPYDS